MKKKYEVVLDVVVGNRRIQITKNSQNYILKIGKITLKDFERKASRELYHNVDELREKLKEMGISLNLPDKERIVMKNTNTPKSNKRWWDKILDRWNIK